MSEQDRAERPGPWTQATRWGKRGWGWGGASLCRGAGGRARRSGRLHVPGRGPAVRPRPLLRHRFIPQSRPALSFCEVQAHHGVIRHAAPQGTEASRWGVGPHARRLRPRPGSCTCRKRSAFSAARWRGPRWGLPSEKRGRAIRCLQQEFCSPAPV